MVQVKVLPDKCSTKRLNQMKRFDEPNDTLFASVFKKCMEDDEGRQLLLERFRSGTSVDFEQTMQKYSNQKSMLHIGSGSYANVFRLNSASDNVAAAAAADSVVVGGGGGGSGKETVPNRTYIFKLIRLMPEVLLDRIQNSNVKRTTQYMDGYSEFQISNFLSKLNRSMIHMDTMYSCQMFPLVYQGYLTKGSLPSCFVLKPEVVDEETEDEDEEDDDDYEEEEEEEDSENDENTHENSNCDESEGDKWKQSISENDHRTKPNSKTDSSKSFAVGGGGARYSDIVETFNLSVPEENLVLVMEDCGKPMGDVIDRLEAKSLLSIVKQMIAGFMIAEVVYEFEHRDLHSGNVLLQPFSQSQIQYLFRGKRITIPCYGYRVKIIDTTFSRIRVKQEIYYKDLSHMFDSDSESNLLTEDEMRERKMRMQDIAYLKMSNLVSEEWANFYPKTNLIWLKYVIYKLLKSKVFVEFRQKQEQEKQKQLEREKLNNQMMADKKKNIEKNDDGGVNNCKKRNTRFELLRRQLRRRKNKQTQQQQTVATNKKQQNKNQPVHETEQVENLLKQYSKLCDQCTSAQNLFNTIVRDNVKLNNLVKISCRN